MQRIRIEKRGTRCWVLLKECLNTGNTEIVDSFITKHDAMKYLAKRKLANH